MAIKTVVLTLNGTNYTIPLDSTTGKYVKQITAPTKSSYSQTDHVYAMQLQVTDMAGNVTKIDKSHATFGSALKLRVKEKVAPVISITKPGSGAYLTSNTVDFSVDITDEDSGVASGTISIKLDGTALEVTKTAITGGYRCTYTGTVKDGSHSLAVNVSDNDGNAATEKKIAFVVDTVPPQLNVSSPTADLITNKQACTVAGTTNDATSGLAKVTVTLNGTDQGTVTVAADGSFSKSINLAKGSNTIVVKAIDKAGKSTTVSRSVTYDPDAPVIVSVSHTPDPVNAGGTFTITVEATD